MCTYIHYILGILFSARTSKKGREARCTQKRSFLVKKYDFFKKCISPLRKKVEREKEEVNMFCNTKNDIFGFLEGEIMDSIWALGLQLKVWLVWLSMWSVKMVLTAQNLSLLLTIYTLILQTLFLVSTF